MLIYIYLHVDDAKTQNFISFSVQDSCCIRGGIMSWCVILSTCCPAKHNDHSDLNFIDLLRFFFTSRMDFRKYEVFAMLIIICLVNKPKPQNLSKLSQLRESNSHKYRCYRILCIRILYQNISTFQGIGQKRLRYPAIIAVYVLMQNHCILRKLLPAN